MLNNQVLMENCEWRIENGEWRIVNAYKTFTIKT